MCKEVLAISTIHTKKKKKKLQRLNRNFPLDKRQFNTIGFILVKTISNVLYLQVEFSFSALCGSIFLKSIAFSK